MFQFDPTLQLPPLELIQCVVLIYVKPFVRVTDIESVCVTTTSTDPFACDGALHVIVFGSTTVSDVQGDPPTVTLAPLWKFVPLMVRSVPVVPLVGLTPLTVTTGPVRVLIVASTPVASPE